MNLDKIIANVVKYEKKLVKANDPYSFSEETWKKYKQKHPGTKIHPEIDSKNKITHPSALHTADFIHAQTGSKSKALEHVANLHYGHKEQAENPAHDEKKKKHFQDSADRTADVHNLIKKYAPEDDEQSGLGNDVSHNYYQANPEEHKKKQKEDEEYNKERDKEPKEEEHEDDDKEDSKFSRMPKF